MDAIDRLEQLLMERYNLRAPQGSSLFTAIALVREAATEESIALLRGELANRELYRWREAVDAALAAIQPAPKPAKRTKSREEPTSVKQEASDGSDPGQKPVD